MLREMGFAQSEVLKNTGITEEQLQDPLGLIFFDRYQQLISNSLQMTNNPHLGLTFGKRLHITGYNTLVMLDTSYKEIISDTRKHRAFEYLAGNSLTTNQIANRLGYSDPDLR